MQNGSSEKQPNSRQRNNDETGLTKMDDSAQRNISEMSSPSPPPPPPPPNPIAAEDRRSEKPEKKAIVPSSPNSTAFPTVAANGYAHENKSSQRYDPNQSNGDVSWQKSSKDVLNSASSDEIKLSRGPIPPSTPPAPPREELSAPKKPLENGFSHRSESRSIIIDASSESTRKSRGFSSHSSHSGHNNRDIEADSSVSKQKTLDAYAYVPLSDSFLPPPPPPPFMNEEHDEEQFIAQKVDEFIARFHQQIRLAKMQSYREQLDHDHKAVKFIATIPGRDVIPLSDSFTPPPDSFLTFNPEEISLSDSFPPPPPFPPFLPLLHPPPSFFSPPPLPLPPDSFLRPPPPPIPPNSFLPPPPPRFMNEVHDVVLEEQFTFNPEEVDRKADEFIARFNDHDVIFEEQFTFNREEADSSVLKQKAIDVYVPFSDFFLPPPPPPFMNEEHDVVHEEQFSFNPEEIDRKADEFIARFYEHVVVLEEQFTFNREEADSIVSKQKAIDVYIPLSDSFPLPPPSPFMNEEHEATDRIADEFISRFLEPVVVLEEQFSFNQTVPLSDSFLPPPPPPFMNEEHDVVLEEQFTFNPEEVDRKADEFITRFNDHDVILEEQFIFNREEADSSTLKQKAIDVYVPLSDFFLPPPPPPFMNEEHDVVFEEQFSFNPEEIDRKADEFIARFHEHVVVPEEQFTFNREEADSIVSKQKAIDVYVPLSDSFPLPPPSPFMNEEHEAIDRMADEFIARFLEHVVVLEEQLTFNRTVPLSDSFLPPPPPPFMNEEHDVVLEEQFTFNPEEVDQKADEFFHHTRYHEQISLDRDAIQWRAA